MEIISTQAQVNGLVIYLIMPTDMENYFLNKISCEFAIITHDKDCHIVTNVLGLEPSRFFNKRDKFTSKYSSRIGYKPHGLWAIQSKLVISEELDVSSHVRYFQKLLEDKIELIEKLKNQYQFECVFTISIETEDVGVGIDLNEIELTFITKISSRYTCTFIAKRSIGKG